MRMMINRRPGKSVTAFLLVGLLATAGSDFGTAGELLDSLGSLIEQAADDDYAVRTGFGHHIGSGVGYEDGFSSYSNLIPLIESEDERLLFADVHLLLDNQAMFAANVGVGQRVYDEEMNRTWGLMAWYDYRDTGENRFHQMTIGLESLGEFLDFRSNIYIPDLADDRLPNPADNHFSGNQLIIADEAAMTGVDFEMGASLMEIGQLVTRSFAGGYFLRATGSPDTWGWRGRTEVELTDRFFVNIGVQEDDLFGRTVTVGITLQSLQKVDAPNPAPSWPAFQTMRRPTAPLDHSLVANRLSEPTRRFRNIMIDKQQRVAIDPSTGSAMSFLHVVGGSAGDGSIESPYGTIGDALADLRAPGSLIYTPEGGSFTENLTLVAGTELVSNDRLQYVSTQDGQRILPGSNGNATVTIDGDITLASKTRIDGFDINGQLTGDAVEDVLISHNVINATAGLAGISLTNISNTGDTITITQNTISDGDAGIRVVGDELDLALTENTISDATLAGIELTATGTAASTLLVLDNVLSGNNGGTASEVTVENAGTGTLTLTLTGNSSLNDVPDPGFNFDLINTGGTPDAFTLLPNGLNSGSVGSSDGSVTIP
ncbi:MAG: hypothetical protein CMJ65_15495 [Planctomycetaceae bacterium]|nr:hypothetical protein [Planctomycetaceae bacterium]MDP7276929.1 inverse autotransporter beta domain-containing protein [Planctomycetaceae bacterium]